MKNDVIIASWDRILPDEAANRRMLSDIMEYSRKRRKSPVTLVVKRFLPLAACLAVVISITAFLGIRNNWFVLKNYTVVLESGEKLVYGRSNVKGDACYAYDYEVTDRHLTAEELHDLLPSIAVPEENGLPYAVFKSETGEMLRTELTADDVHIHLAKTGLSLTDCIITGEASTADINGTTVKTGYSISKPNSKGIKRIVFFSEFAINGTSVYLELAGDEEESEQLSQRLSETVSAMVNGTPPDITAIKY